MPRPRRRTPAVDLARAAALAVVALAATAGCGGNATSRPPDIVLISLDSVRADELTFRDESVAPALAALARRGTVFREAIAGSSWTLPSHAELFTGSPPALNGVNLDTIAMDPLQATLPELLAARGYLTAGFFSGGYLDPRFGFGRGFSRYEDCRTQAADAHVGTAGAGGAAAGGAAERGGNGISGPEVVARVEALLATVPADRPLFLFAHIFDPHYDYIPPPPFDARFDPGYAGDLDPRNYWNNRRIYDPDRTPPRQIGERDLQHVRALYRGEIAWTDANVARLLDALARHGRLRNAVIVVTSDHGEEFFEHGNRGHRNTLFDEVLRVPMLLVPPAAGEASSGEASASRDDRPPGSAAEVGEPVSLSDVAPTLLDFAGAAAPPSMSGVSLRGAAFGALPPRRAMVGTLCVPAVEHGTPGLWLTESLRTPETKFLLAFRYEAATGLKLRGARLCDLVRDPGETAPQLLAPGDPRLRQQWDALEAQLDGLRARHASGPHAPEAARAVEPSALADENLRALGYAGGDVAGAAPLRLPWGVGPRQRLPLPTGGP